MKWKLSGMGYRCPERMNREIEIGMRRGTRRSSILGRICRYVTVGLQIPTIG